MRIEILSYVGGAKVEIAVFYGPPVCAGLLPNQQGASSEMLQCLQKTQSSTGTRNNKHVHNTQKKTMKAGGRKIKGDKQSDRMKTKMTNSSTTTMERWRGGGVILPIATPTMQLLHSPT